MDPGALSYLGDAYLQLGKVDAAIHSYQKALSISPDLTLAREGLKKAESEKQRQ
jgi:tetratricopeptide (TPR) repeat protein